MQTDLQDINGVGPATARKLNEQGYTYVEELPEDQEGLEALDFNADEIAQVLEIQAASAAEAADASQQDEEVGNEAGDSQAEDSPEASAETSSEKSEDEQTPEESQPENEEPSGELMGNLAADNPDEGEQDTTSEDSDASAESAEDGERVLTASIVSGPHKNRKFELKVGDPAVRFHDGAYMTLGTFAVHLIGEEEDYEESDTVDFKLVWAQTVSRARMDKADFTLFNQEVKKNRLPQRVTGYRG